MKIKSGNDGGLYAVFEDAHDAGRFEWLFWSLLRRQRACFGQYDNAYKLI